VKQDSRRQEAEWHVAVDGVVFAHRQRLEALEARVEELEALFDRLMAAAPVLIRVLAAENAMWDDPTPTDQVSSVKDRATGRGSVNKIATRK
jgi:hypothetical protein